MTTLPIESSQRQGASDARDGEFIGAGSMGLGGLSDPHTDESPANELRGKADAVNVEQITKEWVLARLLKEATDFGSRTRQSSRVKALELLGKSLSMFTEVVEHKDPVLDALRQMEPWERRQRILELASRMAQDPAFASTVAKEAAKQEPKA